MRRRAILLSAAACATASVSASVAGAQPDPHGGGGRGHGGQPGGYSPPEDVVSPNPEIPAGTIVVRIVDADEKPVAGVPVRLAALHQSVAQGDTKESFTGTTNEDGFVQFEGQKVGVGHAYNVHATHQHGEFSSSQFGLTQQAAGVAVILHVFDVSSQIADTMVFTPDARLFVSLKDDVLVVTYEALLANPSPVAWLADYHMVMPPEFKAFTAEEGSVPALIGTDEGVRIRGTVRPGGAVIRFRFHVPHHEEADVALAITMPPRTTRVMVAAEASKNMGLSGDGFPKEAERVRDRGRTLLKIDKQWSPRDGENFFSKVNLKLTGLPTRGIAPWVAAGLAATTAGGALAYVFSRRGKDQTLAADTRDDLLEAKEAMLLEIVELERAHRTGAVGPRAYDRLRKAMLDALARIVDRLEAVPASPAPFGGWPAGKGPDDEAASSSGSEPPPEPVPRAPRARKKKRARPATTPKATGDGGDEGA